MILTLLEDKSEFLRSAGLREQKLNHQLQKFSGITSRLLSGEMLSALLSTLTGLSLKNEPELYLWGLQVRLHDSSGPLLFPALKSAREIFERGISKF